MLITDICVALGLAEREVRCLGVVWGKSRARAGGVTNLLIAHMLDTAAVAELIWDGYLAPHTRRQIDTVAPDGDGRRFFAWLCGIHDCGKATPSFQRVDGTEAALLAEAGLCWDTGMVNRSTSRAWRHDKAGGALLRSVLKSAGWGREQIAWVWPLVAGHHGTVAAQQPSDRTYAQGHAQGKSPEWKTVQRQLVEVFTRALGYDALCAVQPAAVPARAVQLGLLGYVVMADWIASDETHFTGLDRLEAISFDGARARSRAAWAALRLEGGLRGLEGAGDVFTSRFGHGPRPSQNLVVDAVRRMDAPGLTIVEGPMGEGKTKTLLAVTEVIAERFGFSGLFLGMPTQATADPMLEQVCRWADAVSPGAGSDAVLLHGKRAFNPVWKAMMDAERRASYESVQEDGDVDCCEREHHAPADWFLGAKRGLLGHLVVGTIDQLLHAATRTRHVMLRHAGLAGKVVGLDEVHAADVYMSQFLKESLRWLGQARIPVVLLSATLPPAQRQVLTDAYLSGARNEPHFTAPLPDAAGYPAVTCAWQDPAAVAPVVTVDACAPWRRDMPVRVCSLPEAEDPDQPVVDTLRAQLAAGGCALVIRNTVKRAQRTFRRLQAEFGDDTVILHGQLTVRERAERSEDIIARLGPGDDQPRPARMIVVATQVAEQSFDVDADVLITDITPIDLLLQRIGRMWRHDGTLRPAAITEPVVYVTAWHPQPDNGVPRFERGAEYIYGTWLLLRTAALVSSASAGGGWSIPGDVPWLVAEVYNGDPLVPAAWRAAEQQACEAWRREQEQRAVNAERYLLARPADRDAVTLAGLHYAAADAQDEQRLRAVVRDGEDSVEVVLVVHTAGSYRTLEGTSLGAAGELSGGHVDELAGDILRLPVALTGNHAPESLGLVPLPGWSSHPWLRQARALVLDAALVGRAGPYRVSCDRDIGLTYER
ncbi:CRISPR-associated helicase Cas3' [Streptomyces sp. NPDC015345]|uniref:CRISPR-associated helicase Cas3' n=1 Tax=Streptomyces sp. NPDC015345 TaxID=3364953 RepID=UPI0036FB011F